MTAPAEALPEHANLLDESEFESVVAHLPMALIALSSTSNGASEGILFPGGLFGGPPTDVLAARRARLSQVVDPAYVAEVTAMLAQESPPSLPAATRLSLTTETGRVEVLATCRLMPVAGGYPLLAFVEAPPESSRDECLRRRDELLAAAERIAQLGSWDWNITADSVTWSDELYRIYGYEPHAIDVTLSTVLDHTIPEDRDYTRSVIERGLVSHLPFTYAHRIRRPTGEIRVLHSRGGITQVDENGNPSHMVGACRDVTTQQDLRDEDRQFQELYERERRVAEQLREVEQLKDTLVAAVSHDLRTPLTVILGSATTLRDHGPSLDPDTRQALFDNMADNADRLESMLADLLDLDRVRRGELLPQLEHVVLHDLLAGLLRRGNYDLDRITLEESGADVTADVDASKVERIIDNLLRNALRHTPPGTPIWLRVEADEDSAIIVVEDAGPGVPKEARVRVLEPFERGTHTTHSGSGLGLAIASQFAALHGGSLWIDDRPGGGASFHVRLPLREPEHARSRTPKRRG
jgi:signal transduction histidine kinase